MDSDYWRMAAEEEAYKRMDFFNQDGKRQWKVIHIGALNSAPEFVEIMTKLQQNWVTLDNERKLKMSHQTSLLMM